MFLELGLENEAIAKKQGLQQDVLIRNHAVGSTDMGGVEPAGEGQKVIFYTFAYLKSFVPYFRLASMAPFLIS